MTSPEDAVAQFLAESTAKPTRCGTCTHTGAKEIDRAIRAFATARESGETTQEWQSFHKFLVETYGYSLSCFSMRRHIRGCLGLT